MSGVSGLSGGMPGRQGVSGPSGRESRAASARKSASAPYTSPLRPPIVASVQQTEAVEQDDAAPIRTLPARPRPLRVRPENQDRLRDAKRRLSALFNVETDESLLLNQLLEERLEEWVREKEGLATKAGRKRERSE
jgi:hypothetical protein